MGIIDELRSLKDQLLFDETFKVSGGTKHVVIAGMGGSGIAGKIFKELYTKVQVSTVADYGIPEFVGRDTLFIGVSYSGNTEETISALESAKRKGAHTVAITSGGIMSDMAQQTVIVQKGLQPRSSLGYLLMPLLNSFGAVSSDAIKEAIHMLDGLDKDNAEERLIAKEIFARRAIPVIYGISPYDAVAYRWKTQFNENSKVIAYSSSFPELNHNDTMALQGTYRKRELYFMAFTDGNNRLLERRIDTTEKLTHTKFRRIRAEGASEFARVMDLVHKGDYVSYHLAILRKKDPVDISVIEELKKALKQP